MPSGCRGIGPWLLKKLAEFYNGDEDEAEGDDEEAPGGSQRGAFLPHMMLNEIICCF